MQHRGERGSSPEREPLDGYHTPRSPRSPRSAHNAQSPTWPPVSRFDDFEGPLYHYPPPLPPGITLRDLGYPVDRLYGNDIARLYINVRTGNHAPRYVQELEDSTHHPNLLDFALAQNNVTPGSDNCSALAVGSYADMGYAAAGRNAGEHGMPTAVPGPSFYAQDPDGGSGDTYGDGYDYGDGPGNSDGYPDSEHGSLGMSGVNSSRSPCPGVTRDPYADDHYPQVHAAGSRASNPMLGIVNPNEIVDDGDDGLDYSRRSQRNSTLGADAAKGAAAVTTGKAADSNAAGGDVGGLVDNGSTEEKSAWMAQHASQSKKWRWAITIVVILLIIGGIVGGVVGSRVANHEYAMDL